MLLLLLLLLSLLEKSYTLRFRKYWPHYLFFLVAQSVVKHDQHILNGATLHVSLELLNNPENTSKTIQITGLTAQSTEDSIRNYFENERRSGGGEVEAVTFRPEENMALVTFKDVEGEFFTVSLQNRCNFLRFSIKRR